MNCGQQRMGSAAWPSGLKRCSLELSEHVEDDNGFPGFNGSDDMREIDRDLDPMPRGNERR